MIEPRVLFATIRDGGYDEQWDAQELHLECRFEDGQKYAAVIVDGSCPDLAEYICRCINERLPLE